MDEPIVMERVVARETPVELPEAFQEPARRKSLLFIILYGISNVAIGMATISLTALLLPAQINALISVNQTAMYALIVGLGAGAAVLTNPLVGWMSDRTTSRLGRRRPWIIAGGILAFIAILLLSLAPSLAAIAFEWVFLLVAINIVQVAISSIVPDQIPIEQRATASALTTGVGVMLGGLLGDILVAQVFKTIQGGYTAIAVAAVIALALFLVVLRDARLPKEHVPPSNARKALSALKPLAERDFLLVWLARCLIFLGYTTVVNFMFYFLQDAIHYTRLFPTQTTAQGVQLFFALMVLSIIVGSLVGGIISDKIGRRKLFIIVACLLLAIGLLIYALFPLWTFVLIGTAVTGIGMGIFLAVDLALASQVLPVAADRGKDIGIINTAIFLPMLVSPLIAGIVLSTLNSYLVLFIILAIAALAAAVLVLPIRSVR